MNAFQETLLNTANDHIMANTWRLIFEEKASSTKTNSTWRPGVDFSMLAELLPEYRLMGRYLADAARPGSRYD